jgi:hypothetical protein
MTIVWHADTLQAIENKPIWRAFQNPVVEGWTGFWNAQLRFLG